ncbi:MAG: cytochrome c biogenesis protein ResB, partial [Gemmataceae bacterium]|nr:cytochrome c biogenesis protein ResB [Gemmataceae bacterium]
MSVVLPPAPATGRARPQQNPLEAGLKALASLRLTVVLLAMGCFLVFVGTIAQIDGGIWTIVRDYFRSFFVWVPFKLFAQLGQIFVGFPKDASVVGGAFPFPGGWTIGTLMLINLVAAHATRFRFQANRIGIIAIHTGLIVLMLGELMAGLFQIESRMTIGHGETVGFVEDSRVTELAIIDPADPNTNTEVTIPESMVIRLGKITHEKLPVDLEVVEWFPNAELQPLRKGMPDKDVFVSKQGVPFTLFRKGEGSGVDAASHDDAASARINIYKKGTSELIGTKVVSLWLTPNFTKRIPSFQFPPQEFTADGKTYQIELRGRRDYLPFTLRLNEFNFDRYPGTNIPKNYSSRVTLNDPRTNANRDVLIRMNEPLAYEGATYYQSGFTPDEKGTVLQATRNPGVWLPYISCVLMSLGMLVHFGQQLFAFLTRGASVDRSARASALRPSNVWIVAGAGAVLVIGGIV